MIRLISLLLIFCSLFWQTAVAQYSYQYFDGQEGMHYYADSTQSNVWQVGPPQKSIFNAASTHPNAAVTDTVNYYPENNESTLTFEVSNDYGFYGGYTTINWRQKIDFGPSNDGGIVEIRSNDTSEWANIFDNPYVYEVFGFVPENLGTLSTGDWAFSGTDTLWRHIWLCLESDFYATDLSLQIRFRMVSDDIASEHEGWMIDNLAYETIFPHTLEDLVADGIYMTVGPNPTSGRIQILSEKIPDYHIIESIEVWNMQGRAVRQYGKSPTKFWIDIGDLPKGVYFIKVKTNLREETFKVLLQP